MSALCWWCYYIVFRGSSQPLAKKHPTHWRSSSPTMAIRRLPSRRCGRPSPQNFQISNPNPNPNPFANPNATTYNSLMKFETKNYYTYNGETHSLKEWATILSIPYNTLKGRNHRGWTLERIVTTPMEPRLYSVTIKGVTLTLNEWRTLLGISKQALHKAAKTHNITQKEELICRFNQNPTLFPQKIVENDSKPQ